MATLEFFLPPTERKPGAISTPETPIFNDSMRLFTSNIRRTLFNRNGRAWQWVGDQDYAIPFPFSPPNQLGYFEAVAQVELAEATAGEPRRPWIGSIVSLAVAIEYEGREYPPLSSAKVIEIVRTIDGNENVYVTRCNGDILHLVDGEFNIQ